MLRARMVCLTTLILLLGACSVRAPTTGVTNGGSTPPPTNGGGGGGAPPPVASPNWPTLAPGAGFNGTPCSGYPGGACLTAVTRSTAAPAVHWIVPSDLRVVNDTLVCVDADAKGGVSKVRFYGEGGSVDVTAPGLIQDTDVNGRARTRYGYCAKLDSAAWKAKTTTGSARLFAEAFPVDGTMQSRRIGISHNDYNGDYQMVVYPRPTANDWSRTVCASGCDYSTIKLAIDAAAAAGAKAPLITIGASGFYELQNRTPEASGDGFMTITTAPGVTATLGRATPYSGSATNSGNAWLWTPGWEAIEFRGQGILFDQRNWTVVNTSKPVWFNGVRFTNSIGTRDTYYWNGAGHPIFGAAAGAYWDDSYVEYLSGGLEGQRYVINTQVRNTYGDIFSQTHYLFNNYVRGATAEFFRGATPGIRLSYSGGGAGTVDVAGNTLTLKQNGAPVATIPLGTYATDQYPTVDAVVAAVNATPGWTASAANGKGGMRASFLWNSAGLVVTTNTPIVAAQDIHGDWWQSYSGANTRSNVLIRGNVMRDAALYNSYIFDDAAVGQDFIFKNNIWQGRGVGGMGVGGNTRSHFVFDNNVLEGWIQRNQGSAGDKLYSEFRNNIVGTVTSNGAPGACIQDAPWVNNLYYQHPFAGCSMNAAPGESGNFTYAVADINTGWQDNFEALFVGAATGNFVPANGSAIALNLKPLVDSLDQRGCLRQANDGVGAWATSLTCTITAWPF